MRTSALPAKPDHASDSQPPVGQPVTPIDTFTDESTGYSEDTLVDDDGLFTLILISDLNAESSDLRNGLRDHLRHHGCGKRFITQWILPKERAGSGNDASCSVFATDNPADVEDVLRPRHGRFWGRQLNEDRPNAPDVLGGSLIQEQLGTDYLPPRIRLQPRSSAQLRGVKPVT